MPLARLMRSLKRIIANVYLVSKVMDIIVSARHVSLVSVGVPMATNTSITSANGPLSVTKSIKVNSIHHGHNKPLFYPFLCVLVSCNEVNICNPNAQCVLLAISTKPQPEYTCQCNPGFSGDGFQCAELIGSVVPPLILPSPIESMGETSSCDIKDNCGPQATCVYDDEALKSVCVCNDGYRGDGFLCTPMG